MIYFSTKEIVSQRLLMLKFWLNRASKIALDRQKPNVKSVMLVLMSVLMFVDSTASTYRVFTPGLKHCAFKCFLLPPCSDSELLYVSTYVLCWKNSQNY